MSSPTRDFDEWPDRVFSRPMAARLVKQLVKTSMTADQVTLVSGTAGVAAGVLYAFPGTWPLFGSILLVAMMVLDCADGQLARLRGGGSWRGRVLDGMADYATALSVHAGVCIQLWLSGVGAIHPLLLLTLVVLAAASMAWSAQVLDGLKQRLKPESPDTRLNELNIEMMGLWDSIIYRILTRYVSLIGTDQGTAAPGTYAQYRRVTLVGPTTHLCVLAGAGCLTPWWPGAFLGYLLLTIGPANLYLLWVLQTPPSTEVGDGAENEPGAKT
jgi:phosphatidylglycerophosphate synthase